MLLHIEHTSKRLHIYTKNILQTTDILMFSDNLIVSFISHGCCNCHRKRLHLTRSFRNLYSCYYIQLLQRKTLDVPAYPTIPQDSQGTNPETAATFTSNPKQNQTGVFECVSTMKRLSAGTVNHRPEKPHPISHVQPNPSHTPRSLIAGAES